MVSVHSSKTPAKTGSQAGGLFLVSYCPIPVCGPVETSDLAQSLSCHDGKACQSSWQQKCVASQEEGDQKQGQALTLKANPNSLCLSAKPTFQRFHSFLRQCHQLGTKSLLGLFPMQTITSGT